MPPDPRTLQANERTLLAWLRTGISLITFGFAIAQLGEWLRGSGRTHRLGQPEVIGGLFVLMGALGQILAIVRFRRIRRALLEDRPVPTDAPALITIVTLVAVIGLVLGADVLLLR